MSGNLYLMSDVHGYFIPFLQILEKIRFEDADRMVILGSCGERTGFPGTFALCDGT